MAYIGRTPTNAALTAADLADGIVSTAKIAADAVTDAKIADDVVGTEHLTANEVDTAALKGDAVTGAELADNAVNSEHYTDGSIDTAHIADDQVTAAKINNDIISGTTALTSEPATTDELLISDAGILKRIDYSLISNRPAFEASLGSDQSIADTAKDKLQINTVSLDTNSCYNTSSYRFTANVAGNYFVYCKAYFDDAAGDVRQVIVELHKNGSALARSNLNFDNATTNEAEGGTVVINTTVQMNGSSDYLEVFAEVDTNDGGACDVQGSQRKTNFGAYKLIGV